MNNRYWLVQVDFEYMADSYGDYTTLKTKAGRLRDKDLPVLKVYIEQAGFDMDCVTFVPTTYKPKGTSFIEPMLFSWTHAPGVHHG